MNITCSRPETAIHTLSHKAIYRTRKIPPLYIHLGARVEDIVHDRTLNRDFVLAVLLLQQHSKNLNRRLET